MITVFSDKSGYRYDRSCDLSRKQYPLNHAYYTQTYTHIHIHSLHTDMYMYVVSLFLRCDRVIAVA